MTRYHEFVEAVFAQLIAGDPATLSDPKSAFQLAADLGIRVSEWTSGGRPPDWQPVIDAALDLETIGLATIGSVHHIRPTDRARAFRQHPVHEIYPELRAPVLEVDEEQFLRALASRSELSREGWGEVREVRISDVYADLGLPPDGQRDWRYWHRLHDAHYLAGSLLMATDQDWRITYAGMIRVLDVPSERLAEAREHLQHGHLRAAGCVAGVVLERHLKALCEARQLTISGSSNLDKRTIEECNQALAKDHAYGLTTKRDVQGLADVRNDCAHWRGLEPSVADVGRLIDGVDRILRTVGSSGRRIVPAR